MIAMRSNAEDIRRYFQHTFVKFKEHGDTLFFIQDVNDREIRGITEDSDDFVVYLDDEYPFNLDYVLPNRAIFQHRDRVAMLQRIPARQYRRGLCAENTKMFYVSSAANLDINFTNLKRFVTKASYRSLKEALYGKGRDKEIALNSRMWFARPSQMLYCDTTPIGLFNRELKEFISVPALMQEEVNALIAQDPFEVKVRK